MKYIYPGKKQFLFSFFLSANDSFREKSIPARFSVLLTINNLTGVWFG